MPLLLFHFETAENFSLKYLTAWLPPVKPSSDAGLCYSYQEQNTTYPRSRREDGQTRGSTSVSIVPKTTDALRNTVAATANPWGQHGHSFNPTTLIAGFIQTP